MFYDNAFVMEISYWRKNLIKYEFLLNSCQGKLFWFSGCKRVSGVTSGISSNFTFVSTEIHKSQSDLSMEF